MPKDDEKKGTLGACIGSSNFVGQKADKVNTWDLLDPMPPVPEEDESDTTPR